MKAPAAEATIVRRAFEAWSIEMPASFEELFVEEDGYWHGYDEHRSISITSMIVTDDHGPVNAGRLLRQFRADQAGMPQGQPVVEVPPGLRGWASICKAPQSSRAARMLSGMLFSDGRVLITTITSNDLDWARATWLSIRSHGIPVTRLH